MQRSKRAAMVSAAERRLWLLLVIYIAAALLCGSGTLARYELEAADGEAQEEEYGVETDSKSEQILRQPENEELPRRRAVEYEWPPWKERSWFEELLACALLPQLCYPFFLTVLVFLAGKKLARKAATGDNNSAGILLLGSISAFVGTSLFFAGERNPGLLAVSGLFIIASGLFAGMAYAARKESRWLVAVPPLVALALELLFLVCSAHSILESLA